MTVLVCAASRHGATAEIAEAVGRILTRHGIVVDVRPAGQVTQVDGYDAVVLGSGVYLGRWLKPAYTLATSGARALSGRPVWLFSSGPVGSPPKPGEGPVDVPAIVAATGAREHRVFGGVVRRHGLGLAERAMVAALRVPDGDYRDWAEIERWAAGIGETLCRELGAVA